MYEAYLLSKFPRIREDNFVQSRNRSVYRIKNRSAISRGLVSAGIVARSQTLHEGVLVFRSLEQSRPMASSERFPRLTCFLVSCGIVAAALVTEIDCLRGAGYYWR